MEPASINDGPASVRVGLASSLANLVSIYSRVTLSCRLVKLSPRFVVRNLGGSLFKATLVLPTNARLPPVQGPPTKGGWTNGRVWMVLCGFYAWECHVTLLVISGSGASVPRSWLWCRVTPVNFWFGTKPKPNGCGRVSGMLCARGRCGATLCRALVQGGGCFDEALPCAYL